MSTDDDDGKRRGINWALWINSIGVLTGVIGGIIALVAYLADLQTRLDGRVVQTFDFFNQLSTQSMIDIRQRIESESWCRRYSGRETRGLGPTSAQITTYVDFFDAARVCVREHLCHEELTSSLFRPYAQRAFHDLEQEVQYRREAGDETFGEGLEFFAGETEKLECPNIPLEEPPGGAPPVDVPMNEAAPTSLPQ